MDRNINAMHQKIGKLQLQFSDYPVQTNPSKGKKSSESNERIQGHKLRKERKSTPLLDRCYVFSVFVTSQFMLPFLVYTSEEYSEFFWLATGFSTVVTVSLLFYLSYRIPFLMTGFHGVHSKVKIVIQDTEYFSNRKRIQCGLLVLVILLILGVGHWADGSNPVLFNSCLVAVGYIAGLLSVSLYEFFMQSKRLPYYSPLHKKREGPNPAKRELDFSSAALTSSPCLNPMDCFRPSPERDMNCSELIHRGPLPVPPLPPPLKYSPSKPVKSYSPFN